MAKSLKDILAGTKSSKTETPDLSDIHDYGKGAGKEFISKHKIEKHADRVGNDDDVYKGKTKKVKYKGVNEAEEWKVGDKVTYQKNKKERGNAVVSYAKSAKKNHLYIKTETEGTLFVPHSELQRIKEEFELDESNKENKAKKKALKDVKKDKPVNKFDPREAFSAMKRGRMAESSCNSSPAGTHCEMHGEDDCSGSMEKKKGKKLLLDKDKKED